MFGRHFTHNRRRNETRCDEVMPYLGDVGQMFGLEVDRMPFTINLPLTLPVSQYPNDLRVVGLHMEPIKGLRGNWVKVIISVDRLCTKFTNTPRTLTFFKTWEARLA